MMHTYTHIGTLMGDARNGNRSVRRWLRLTPSGQHWVDTAGKRYRVTGGGYLGDKWPLWSLDASSIQPLSTPQKK